MVHRIGSGEPQRAACLYERLISEWWGVRLTWLRKNGFLHLRFRYFEKTELDFWFSNFLSYIFLISSHLRKNTAFSCGVFAVHLFYQHILVPVAGLEPARHRWQWILSPPRLPIPTHRHIIESLGMNSKVKNNPSQIIFIITQLHWEYKYKLRSSGKS